MSWSRPSIRLYEPPEVPEPDETLTDWVAACLVHQAPALDHQAIADSVFRPSRIGRPGAPGSPASLSEES